MTGRPQGGDLGESVAAGRFADAAFNRASALVREHATGYGSRFNGWEQRATVRRPRTGTRWAEDPGTVAFPPELYPVVAHPFVVARGPALTQWLLAQRLLQYLHFTVELESRAIVPVTGDLARGRTDLVLPDEMRRDAFRIVTDEAWHATFSYELMNEARDGTRIVPVLPADPQFVHRLADIGAGLAAAARGPYELVFATVSETLISSILAGLPADRRLPGPVREAVRDHAEDEGRHHAYFRDVLARLWPALSKTQRTELGRRVPLMIRTFLEPDLLTDGAVLLAAGFSAAETDQILRESFPRSAVSGNIRVAARSLIRYFEEAGAFAEPAVEAAFAEAELL